MITFSNIWMTTVTIPWMWGTWGQVVNCNYSGAKKTHKVRCPSLNIINNLSPPKCHRLQYFSLQVIFLRNLPRNFTCLLNKWKTEPLWLTAKSTLSSSVGSKRLSWHSVSSSVQLSTIYVDITIRINHLLLCCMIILRCSLNVTVTIQNWTVRIFASCLRHN